MPVMPRLSKKALKVFVKIMGLPAPMRNTRTKEQKKLNQRLIFEETVRVR